MSLFAASLIPGFALVLLGLALAMDVSAVKASIKAFPRSNSVGYLVFGVAAGVPVRTEYLKM